MVYKTFFDNTSWNFLKESFSEYISFQSFRDNVELELDKTFLFLKHSDVLVRMIGAERLYEQLDHPVLKEKLLEGRNFTYEDFFSITLNLDLKERYL
jgi:hypothetical protein